MVSDHGAADRKRAATDLCPLSRAAVPISVVNRRKVGPVLPFLMFPETIASSVGLDLFRTNFGRYDGHVSCRVKPDISTMESPA